MLTNSQDFLYLSLGIGFIILVIFICVTLLYLILILHDINYLVEKSKRTVDTINDYLIKPVKLINRLSDNLKPIVDIIEKKIEERIHKYQKRK